MRLIRYIPLVCIILTGCGHNVYVEQDTAGLYLAFPVGIEGSRASVCLGSAKTVVATVRGGTGFTTETSTGGGIFSGSAGTAKVTQFKSNTQLNEGNLEKIMTSTDVPDDVKLVLAKQLAKNTSAPEFLPTGTATREAATEANGNTNVINQFNATGIDKVVETIPEVVKPIAEAVPETVKPIAEAVPETVKPVVEAVPETVKPVVHAAESIVNSTISNTTTVITSTVDTTGEVINNTVDSVVETTGNIRKTWNCIAFVSFIACILCVLLNFTKKTKKVKVIANKINDVIPPPKIQTDPPSETDDVEAEAFVNDPGFHAGEKPNKEQPAKETKPKKKPGFFKRCFKVIGGFFVTIFTFWRSIPEEQQDAIVDGVKKKLKK